MLKCLIFVLAVASVRANYESYSAQPQTLPMSEQPSVMPRSPCTEEVMRAPEIQLFSNPTDKSSYLVCTDVDISISMPCSPGTIFNQDLKHCIPIGWESPICPVGTCMNNADCIVDDENQASCICRVGFTGPRCEINIDECALEGNRVCADYNGRCVDQINAFYCEYENGAEIGLSWENRIPRPCSLEDIMKGKQFYELPSAAGNVFLQCTSENQFLVTKCADMLFWHQELRTCSIERPLEKTGVCKTYPCLNDGECIDLGSSNFQCLCKEGYTGSMCEEVIDFCLNEPCQMGGRCVSHPGGYNCICQDKLVDDSCSTGAQNPCVEGSNEYFSNMVDRSKYISCSLGYGFVKSCAPGTFWDQRTLSCLMPEKPKTLPKTLPKMTIPTPASSYGKMTPTPRPMMPMPTPTPVERVTPSNPLKPSYGQRMLSFFKY